MCELVVEADSGEMVPVIPSFSEAALM